MLPAVLVIAVIRGKKSEKVPWIEYFLVMVGMAVASWLFYDLPVCGPPGFRACFECSQYVVKERYLILIWTALLCVGAFVPDWIRHRLIKILLVRVAITMALTVPPVFVFIQIFPDPRNDGARGILAALGLRIGLFYALLCRPTHMGTDRKSSSAQNDSKRV
jgi:hypothetical protein